METLLKKPEIFRDSMGRFDRHGKTLSKTANRTNGHLIKRTRKSNARAMANSQRVREGHELALVALQAH